MDIECSVIEKILWHLMPGFPILFFFLFHFFFLQARKLRGYESFFKINFSHSNSNLFRMKCTRRLHITVTFPIYVRSIDLRIRLSNLKSNDYGSTSYYSFFQHGLVMLAFSGGASSEILVRLKGYIFWGSFLLHFLAIYVEK